MRFRTFLLIPLLMLCAAPKPGAAQTISLPAPSMKPLHGEWQKIHKAGLILTGTLITRAHRPAKPQEPLLLKIRDVTVLKGALAKNQTNSGIVRARYLLPYSIKPAALEKELRYVQGLFGKPVLVFAESTSGLNELETAVQVLSGRDTAIFPAHSPDAKKVRAEIKNQAAITAWFPTSPLSRVPASDPWEITVSKGLDRLVRDTRIDRRGDVAIEMKDAQFKQQACVDAIEAWGPESYPYLIRHMSDRRSLPGLPVGYNAPKNPFESKYYLSPEKVAEVIDSVLTFSTGADVSPIDLRPGASEAQLAAVTQAWWIYLAYSQSPHSAASNK